MEFSPPKRPQRSKWLEVEVPASPENVEEKPVLVLKPFTTVPHISFNKVKIGSTKCCNLFLLNPLDVRQIVHVEKVPTSKGFFIENEEYVLSPGEEKPIEIFWAPEKVSSYREAVAFKSSTGCKTHAYLLGTAYLPTKKSSTRVVSCKSKKYTKKKSSPKNVKVCNTLSKKAFIPDFKVHEEIKENVDFLNTKCGPSASMSEHINFKFPSMIEPRASFCLKAGDEFPDSPIRRQTYTINSMLLNGRKSEILPISQTEPFINRKTENTWKGNEMELSTDSGKISFQNPHKTFLSTLCKEENLNDSLENIKVPNRDFLSDLNDSLTEAEVKHKSVLSDTSCITDSVKTYDIDTKHLYFGYTPQTSQKNDTKFVKPIPCINKQIVSNENEFLASNYSISDETCDVDVLDCFVKSNDVTDFLNWSKFHENSFENESIFVSELCREYSATKESISLEKEHRKCDRKKNNGGSHVIINEDSNEILQNKRKSVSENHSITLQAKHNVNEGLPEKTDKNYIKENVLKETKTSVFLEIPNDPPNSFSNSLTVSKLSKYEKKPGFTAEIKYPKKSHMSSPLKKRTMKSRSVLASKESLQRSSISKAVTTVGNKEKLSKRMPRKLCLNKPPRISESVVYHRNPFASMNIYYDEHWIEKQGVAFTSWLNFVLTPNDDFSSEDVKVDSAKLWIESIKETSSVPAPTKEELSLKAYTALRNLNALRKSSFSLYQSEDIVAVIKKIEKEVDLKRINIRKDRAIHADLGIKKDILEMLLSYNTLWLRIGLETVYGEVIALQNNSDVLGLSRFIVHRFLHNPEIACKYLHPSVINYYKKGYDDAIQRFTLKKFLLLVFFLDTAKNVHLIKHNPCLFNKNAKYKSSRSLLLAFSRDYLSGEGDITKHLRYLGYKVSYQQTALEEFDFSVRNIAVDLRCGLRLGRVVELLLQDWSISQNLRINTLNRLTKIHNNDVILKALKNASIEIDNNIEAKHITDGDRERTLDLLWQIIFKTQISKLINKDLLKKENAFLHRSLKLKADFAAYNALRKPESTFDKHEISVLDSKLYKENEILQLLFQWCQNVCAHYGMRIHNFTSSFSDGRALCLLLHHYHPNVLPYESIKAETTNSYFEKQMQIAEVSESCPFYMQDDQLNAVTEKLLKNERDNLALVFKKFQDIGNIPILCCSDMSNTMPDEKVMITFVSYINIRLMELSIEIRAARKILHAWQKYKLRKKHQKLKIEIQAVKIIQKAWNAYLEKKRMTAQLKAAVKIQTYWRMYSAKKELEKLKENKRLELLNKSAICIQAAFRCFLARKRNLKHHQAATIIQSYFRKWSARTHFIKLRNIVLKIQQNYCAKVLGQKQRLQYITMYQTIIKLQAYGKGMLVRKCFKKQQLSAVKIQSYFRMWILKRRYNAMRKACIVIQQKFRGYLLTEFYSQEYQNHRFAAITIQKWYRNVIFQQHKIKCITIIQACVRRYIVRKKYLIFCASAVRIQTWWHALSAGKKARLSYVKTYKSIICIQSYIKRYIASRNYSKLKKSAVVIQKNIRRFIAKRKFHEMKHSAIVIQNTWRLKCLTKKLRLEYLAYRKKVIIVQSVIRRFIAVSNFQKKIHAVVTIQKNIRTLLMRQKFNLLKSSAIRIQRSWRASILTRQTRASFLLYRKCIIYVQSLIRRQMAYRDFVKKRQSVIIIQKFVRMCLVKKQYIRLKKSVQLVENHRHNLLYGRQIRENFLKHRKAAIVIQATYRMYTCRKEFHFLRNAVNTVERYRIGRIQRNSFLKLRACAIKLQAVFRGYLCRKSYLKLVKRIIYAQACIRRFILRNKYLKTKASIIKIQRFYWNYKLMCSERQKFLKVRNGFIKLQALYRGTCSRKNIKFLNKNATLIQSAYKMWKAQSHFKQLRQNCLKIQVRYRAKLEMRKQYHKYVKIRGSIVKIQAFVRSYRVRVYYTSLKRSTIIIQSYVRMIRCYRVYHKMKKAAKTIQHYYRSYKLMKATRNNYVQKRSQIIFMQSKMRSFIAKKRFLQQKKACILLQSFTRMCIQKNRYIKIRSAIISLQRYYRNQKMMKVERFSYVQKRQSIIFLQSKIRSMITRRKFLKQKQACIFVQSFVRMYLHHKKYIRLQKATICLQKHYRNWKCMKIQRSCYLLKRKSVILLQAKFRSLLARKMFLKMKRSCIVLQALFRMYSCRKVYIHKRQAVIKLQKYYRSWKLMKSEQNAYFRKRMAIIFLQSKIRSTLICKNYVKQRNSCISIQSYYRMYIQRKKYYEIHKAVVTLQRHYRSRNMMKMCHQNFIKTRNAAIYLQSKFRCLTLRRKFIKQKNACIYIQSIVRMCIEKKKYERIRKATVLIQTCFRNYQISSKIRKYFLSVSRACVILQSYFRMYRCRKQFLKLCSTAVFMQRKYRAKLEACRVKHAFLKLKSACIKIQSYFRMILDIRLFSKCRYACIKIQSKFRSYIARKKYIQTKKATLVLQKYFFAWKTGKKDRCQFLLLKCSTIIIQSFFRGYFVRKSIKQKTNACIKIQSCVRKYICYKSFLKQRNAILTLQKYVRAYITTKKVQQQYVYSKKCIVISQAAVRGFLVRNRLKKLHNSSIKIQAAYRSHVVRMHYIKQRKSVVNIQRFFRSVLLTRKIHQEFKIMQISAIVIQSAFRKYKDRKQFLRKKAAAIILQAHFRRFIAQSRFNRLKQSVSIIEKCYLAYKVLLRDYELYKSMKKSCIKIQAYWKGYALRKRLTTHAEAAIKIQRAFRLWRLRKVCPNIKSLFENQMDLSSALMQRLFYLYLRRSIINFQRAARIYLYRKHKAAIVIQSYFRMWCVQKEFKRLNAAIKIQAWWRAYTVRRSITDKKILEARKRIKAANSEESKKLKNRTTRSLDLLLLQERPLSDILVAVQELDICTKLSPKCCERLVACGGVGILVELVTSCNRSVPHMEIIKLTANVLLNLAKYDKAVNDVWNTDGAIATVLHLMKIFRDKGPIIFAKCCSLLWIFCQDPAKVQIMKTNRDITEDIQSHHSKLTRKRRLEEKQLLSKGIKMKSLSLKKSSSKTNTPMPQKDSLQIDPDWMLGRHRGREFTDPFTAISWLLKALDLKSKIN